MSDGSYNKFPRGAEWRRWDLHVHTPASYLSEYGENWDDYVSNLIEAIKLHKIAVIATADYFTIEGYEKLMSYYDRNTRTLSFGKKSAEVTIIPGIELRLDIANDDDTSINLHFLFDPACSTAFIRDNFLAKLEVKYSGGKYPLTSGSLIGIGRSIIEKKPVDVTTDFSTLTNPDKLRYCKEAYRLITLSLNDVDNAAKEIKRTLGDQKKDKSCISIIAGRGHGSLADLGWFEGNGSLSRTGLTRQNLTYGADLIFSSNDADINFYLGRHPKTDTDEVQQRFGSLKACVWGSDCHSPKTLLHPSNGNTFKYTWIKADPTFEGLRQLLFEPADRVKIQEEEPGRRPDYSVIDSVRFRCANSSILFPTDYIKLNPNLNVIIGGKSSGKSILLYHIARAADPQQVNEKVELVGGEGYSFVDSVGFNFELLWKDGLADALDDEELKSHQITYIPQMYINRLAEQDGEQSLKELIEVILSQNTEYKDARDKIIEAIANTTLKIGHSVTSAFQLLEDGKRLNAEMKAIGDKAAIKANIDKIIKDIEELRKKAGFNQEENLKYEALRRSMEYHQEKHTRYEEYKNSMESHVMFLQTLSAETSQALLNEGAELSVRFEDDVMAHSFINGQSLDEQKEVLVSFERLNKLRTQEINRVKTKIDKHFLSLEKSKREIDPLLKKIANQKQLRTLSSEVEKENLRIKQIEEKEKVLKEISTEGKKVKEELQGNYELLFNHHKALLLLLQNPALRKIGEDLELKANLIFDTEEFSDSFCSLLDGRANFKSTFGTSFTDKNLYSYSEENHLTQIKDIFDKVWRHDSNAIKFKSSAGPRDACYKLFDDYFRIKYTIVQGGDDILKMSPGKKGLVLLQLILHLSNASHPILIDQPEDNLDNRTIFNELNQFIKDKKLQRQIIIVTHNANLVVSTDAEQVIVANQEGQERDGKNLKFKFEYVSGALEHTFIDPSKVGVLYKLGIREHVCDILEGGEEAFKKREEKYGF